MLILFSIHYFFVVIGVLSTKKEARNRKRECTELRLQEVDREEEGKAIMIEEERGNE